MYYVYTGMTLFQFHLCVVMLCQIGEIIFMYLFKRLYHSGSFRQASCYAMFVFWDFPRWIVPLQ